MITEHPILMAGPLVRAVLDGRKTVTRRLAPIRWDTSRYWGNYDCWTFYKGKSPFIGFSESNRGQELAIPHCPFGRVGDTLWVREMWRLDAYDSPPDAHQWCVRFADGATQAIPADVPTDTVVRWASKTGWQPSIHMPRWAARLFLRVV